ncbi:MAG TPA: GTPase [Tepidisphaeraceae bacterium]|nr:GTPase [Tepidisphaeraceae bacterium]
MTAPAISRPSPSINHASLLTPPGAGAIAVVRLTGPLVLAFVNRHLSRPATACRCTHARLLDADRVIDDPVVVRSATDMIDINLHGGEWIVRETLELAKRIGFEIVESEPKLLDAQSPIERELLEWLPAARTEESIRLLLAQPPLWSKLKGGKRTKSEIGQILNDRSLWWMLHPPKIAIVGIPNVGKSTLANQLFGRQRSITADMPGTTRDWVGDFANINGLPVQLIDTPGQRDSTDAIEQTAITRSRGEIDRADLILLVLDPTQPLKPDQARLQKEHPDTLHVINKSDLPSRWNAKKKAIVHTNAVEGQGIDVLRQRICGHFGCVNLEKDRPRWWTARQQDILMRALEDKSALKQL